MCVCTTIFLVSTFIAQTSCKKNVAVGQGDEKEDLDAPCFDIDPISTNSTTIYDKDKLCPLQDCLDTENTWKDIDYSNGADGLKHEKLNNSMLVALLLMIILW